MVQEIALVVGLLVAVGLLGFYLNRQSWKSILKNYEALGNKYGLDLTQPEAKMLGLFRASPYLHGHWNRRETSVQTLGSGMKNTRQSGTAIFMETALREDCVMLIRSKKGLNRLERNEFKNLTKVNGPTEAFNKRVLIATNRPEWVSEKITSSMCERILEDLGSTSGTINLIKGRLGYQELGILSGAAAYERMDRMMTHLNWLANSLEDGEPGTLGKTIEDDPTSI
tara:strand:- start:5558 stop:6235 length:678 start_codon:yes stop_codon:yes gene_type:complete